MIPADCCRPFGGDVAEPVEPLDPRAVAEMEMRHRVERPPGGGPLPARDSARRAAAAVRAAPPAMRWSSCQSSRSSSARSSRLRHLLAQRLDRRPLGRQQQLAGRRPALALEPGAEARDRRQGGEDLEARQLGRQRIDDPLDQEVAEADAGKPALAVRDRIEDRGIGRLRVADRRRLVEQRMDIARHARNQRDLDKDQRLVRHARVKKGKAAAVGLEPVLQVGPAADLVHRLVDHQLFEQRRRRFPGDPLQLEKADVEPVGEQPLQIVLEPAQQPDRAARARSARRGDRRGT